MIRRLFNIGLALAVLLSAGTSWAVEPNEVLADPALEMRARELSKNLRCLVCQNQTIDDSNADLAKDLRLVVRERLTAGDSDIEVIDYVTGRYGDFVLLTPPFKASTYSLWFGPFIFLILGAIAVVFYFRRRKENEAVEDAPEPLTASERKRLKKILEDPENDK